MNELVIQFQCSSEKCGLDYRNSVPDRDNISPQKCLNWPYGPPSSYPIEVYFLYPAMAQCFGTDTNKFMELVTVCNSFRFSLSTDYI
jgi:hypothetical protein